MDLVKERSSEWPISSSSSSSMVDWLSGKKLFWPLFWGYADADMGEDGTGQSLKKVDEEEDEEEYDYTSDYDSGEPFPSGLGGVGGEWDSQWNLGWDSTHSYYGKQAASLSFIPLYLYSCLKTEAV